MLVSHNNIMFFIQNNSFGLVCFIEYKFFFDFIILINLKNIFLHNEKF